MLLLQGGYATSVDVYCSTTCTTTRTTYATHFVTTPSYIAEPLSNNTSRWDAAVIRTAATLPGTAYSLAQVREHSLPVDSLLIQQQCQACYCKPLEGCLQSWLHLRRVQATTWAHVPECCGCD